MGFKNEVTTYSFWILILQTLILAGAGAYVYLFGIPASFKKYLQDEAIEQMGESMAKDYLKKGLDKVPDSNRDDVQELRKRAKDGLPAGLGDQLGKLGGGK